MLDTVRLGDWTVDIGAESFSVARPDTLDLVKELGLEHLIVRPAQSEARIMRSGRKYRIPKGLLGIPSDLDDPQVEEAVGPKAVTLAKQLDAEPWNVPPGCTLAQLVEARLGPDILRGLVEPVVAGVHSSTAANLEVDSIMPGLFTKAAGLGSLTKAAAEIRASAAKPGSAVAGIDGGMQRLIDSLTDDISSAGVQIRTGEAVLSVEPHGLLHEVTLVGGEVILADAVVIATGPNAASRMLSSQTEISNLLAQIRTLDVVVAAVLLDDERLTEAPLGSGILISPRTQGVTAKASTHVSAKWGFWRDAIGDTKQIIRLSYGRDGEVPPIDEDLRQAIGRDLELLYGADSDRVQAIEIRKWNNGLIQGRVGHSALLTAIRTALIQCPGIALIGSGMGGNGITGILSQAKNELQRIGI
ncbi:MAG: hypothetical protein RJA35_1482 [Actinomycetota bacterium]